MRILEADFVGYFAYGFTRARQQILDTIDDGEVNILNGWFARFFLDKVAEIVGREVKLLSTPRYGGQSDLLRLVGIEITDQQFFETGKDIMVDNLTGSKLAVVETKAMVE